jgi:hypothetical protein
VGGYSESQLVTLGDIIRDVLSTGITGLKPDDIIDIPEGLFQTPNPHTRATFR